MIFGTVWKLGDYRHICVKRQVFNEDLAKIYFLLQEVNGEIGLFKVGFNGGRLSDAPLLALEEARRLLP